MIRTIPEAIESDMTGPAGMKAVAGNLDPFQWTPVFPLARIAHTSLTHYNRLCSRLRDAGFWGDEP